MRIVGPHRNGVSAVRGCEEMLTAENAEQRILRILSELCVLRGKTSVFFTHSSGGGCGRTIRPDRPAEFLLESPSIPRIQGVNDGAARPWVGAALPATRDEVKVAGKHSAKGGIAHAWIPYQPGLTSPPPVPRTPVFRWLDGPRASEVFQQRAVCAGPGADQRPDFPALGRRREQGRDAIGRCRSGDRASRRSDAVHEVRRPYGERG